MKVSGCLRITNISNVSITSFGVTRSYTVKSGRPACYYKNGHVTCRACIDYIVLTGRDEGHEPNKTVSLSEEQTRMKKKEPFLCLTWYIRRQFLHMTKFTKEEIKHIT